MLVPGFVSTQSFPPSTRISKYSIRFSSQVSLTDCASSVCLTNTLREHAEDTESNSCTSITVSAETPFPVLISRRLHEAPAIIARNLYRLWFSLPSMMGITWWNIVDNCGAPGEPTISGLFHRDMSPKTSFYALDQLINHEWKTSLECQPDRQGNISWRGFKGTYRITWTDTKGRMHTTEFTLD